MPIDRNLLTKAAKVYEAAEAVEGMKPKEVYESHKKCTPGEFGMNKEGEATPASAVSDPVLKTLAASLPGVGAVGGGTMGGLAGVGLGGLLGGAYGAYDPGAYVGLDEKGNASLRRRSRLMGALRGLGLGSLAGGGVGMVGGSVAGGAHGTHKMKAMLDSMKEKQGHAFKRAADPRMPMPVDGPNHEYLRKNLGNDYYENSYAPDHNKQLLRDAQNTVDYPNDPVSHAQEILNREQRYLAEDKDNAAENTRNSGQAVLATGAARAVSPLFGRYGRMAGEALHGAVTGGKAIEDLVSNPRMVQRQQHEVNQAQQTLDTAKNRWERNPNAWRTENYMAPDRVTAPASPAPFKPTGIPGFVDRVGQQIGNIKMPPARQMYKALHNSVARPFDDVPAMTKSNAALDFGAALGSLGNVGVGGLAGAGLGGLYGLMNPGEEEDEHGRMRRRSRFGAALRGALGGGALGAGGGALATYLQNHAKPAAPAGGAFEYDINNPTAVDRSSKAPLPYQVETMA